MWNEYLGALLFIFAAEMGDKTQILAMLFATKYKVSKVLLGIFIGSLLNHGIAILLGSLLGGLIDTSILQMVAGVAFIAFAYWTLLSKADESDEPIKSSKSAIVTVAMAFFVGELGDKTQLTAITLSIDAVYPVLVLLGTVSGMLVTSSIGIVIGSKVGDKIPELWIKLFSSLLFLFFGVLKLMEGTPVRFISDVTIILLSSIVMLAVAIIVRTFIKGYKSGELTPYLRAAKLLYDYRHKNRLLLEDVCRSSHVCGNCQHTSCGIGLIRHILMDLDEEQLEHHHGEDMEKIICEKDKFDINKLLLMLEANILFLQQYAIDDHKRHEADTIRKIIEILLMGEWIDYSPDIEVYLERLNEKNRNIYEAFKQRI
jgi:Ca2+/H+ antiporter, TMEM165/GDT1 family